MPAPNTGAASSHFRFDQSTDQSHIREMCRTLNQIALATFSVVSQAVLLPSNYIFLENVLAL